MNKFFHQLTPVIGLSFMPQEFKDFLIDGNYSIENLKTDSCVPDSIIKDNIEFNPFQQHTHSYKMEMKDGILTHVDGDCIFEIKSECCNCSNFYKESKLDMVRYSISLLTHYICDLNTFPHLFLSGRFGGDFHAKYEEDMGKFIKLNGNKIKSVKITSYKDLDSELESYAKDVWAKGNEILNRDVNEIKLTDEEKMDICQRCVDMICSIWTMIGVEIGIIKKNK